MPRRSLTPNSDPPAAPEVVSSLERAFDPPPLPPTTPPDDEPMDGVEMLLEAGNEPGVTWMVYRRRGDDVPPLPNGRREAYVGTFDSPLEPERLRQTVGNGIFRLVKRKGGRLGRTGWIELQGATMPATDSATPLDAVRAELVELRTAVTSLRAPAPPGELASLNQALELLGKLKAISGESNTDAAVNLFRTMFELTGEMQTRANGGVDWPGLVRELAPHVKEYLAQRSATAPTPPPLLAAAESSKPPERSSPPALSPRLAVLIEGLLRGCLEDVDPLELADLAELTLQPTELEWVRRQEPSVILGLVPTSHRAQFGPLATSQGVGYLREWSTALRKTRAERWSDEDDATDVSASALEPTATEAPRSGA